MTDWSLPPEWLNALLALLYEAQQGLRNLLHTLGLAPEVHGQPAWPFGWRLAGELLTKEPGHARRVAVSLACVALSLLCLLLALAWRRCRRVVLVLAVLPLLVAPWPQVALLFTPAWATSFHHSPTGFSAASIVAGQAVYQQHCLRCHGADGRGEGPDAARLPMWPPTLNYTLMWRRLDGELFHHVRAGQRGRDGAVTMPEFADALVDQQVWQVLDYLQANASGQTLREAGVWVYPVRLPDAPVLCRQGQRKALSDFRGQHLRLAVLAPGDSAPQDDPRFETVVLGAPSDVEVSCRIDSFEVEEALALVLGVALADLPGHQVLADRAGWLRVRGQPGNVWSEDDLVCKSSAPSVQSAASAASSKASTDEGGLDALIRRMDAEPVRSRRGGFPH